MPFGFLPGAKRLTPGAERPVVVLTRTVDAGKRFFVQQHFEAVVACQTFHHVHYQLVVVVGKVNFLVDGRQFELVGCHLVVTRLNRNAQSLAFNFEVAHEDSHTFGNRTEIVVFELLVFCRRVAHQRAAGQHQVGASHVEAQIDQEIFLLPAKVRVNLGHVLVEVLADVDSGLVHSVESLEQRRLVVERVAGVGDEYRRDAKRRTDDECRRRNVPGRVTASLEGLADAAVGERRCVGLLLCKVLSGKFFDHAAVGTVVDEAVVLLGSAVGQRLEPVGVVNHVVVDGPCLHAGSHAVGNGAVNQLALGYRAFDSLVDRRLKVFFHGFVGEHQLAIEIRYATGGKIHLHRFFLHQIRKCLKS